MDVAEDMIGGEIGITPIVNRPALVLGYAGVYSSFLRHAENASKRFGVPAAKILERVGERKAVGGQEDLIIEVAIELQRDQAAAEADAREPVPVA
jgi:4-hydroxy 2-oxovalerate aldolase